MENNPRKKRGTKIFGESLRIIRGIFIIYPVLYNVIKLRKGVNTMFKYASKIRLVVFTILSIIGLVILVASTVLSIIYNTFAYECGGTLIALTIPSIWSFLLEKTEEQTFTSDSETTAKENV